MSRHFLNLRCAHDMTDMKCELRAGVIFLPGQECAERHEGVLSGTRRRPWNYMVSLMLTLG